MFVIIGDRSRAAARSCDNLCPNCTNYFAVKYALDDREERSCMINYNRPIRLRGPVAVCSDFHDKNKPNKHEMNKMAWIIEPSKRKVGFDVKFTPPSERKDLARDED